jgi:uracil-DNA glycosylase
MSVRDALQQNLETNALLGLKDLPLTLSAPAASPGGTSLPQPVASPRPMSTPRPPAPASPARAVRPATRRAASSPDPAVASEKAAALQTLHESRVKDCQKCHLARTRTQTVFGQGSPNARLVFVGEAPGYEEDKSGLAFVGRAGQLLTQMIQAMTLTRDQVYICNVLKCRPPDNRTPASDEIAACSPYLFEQLRTIDPDVIVALGAPAAQTLLGTSLSIGKLRGQFHDFYTSGLMGVGNPTPLMPTYHPAYLLRSPGEKAKTWEDLKKVMAFLGLEIPARYR